MRFSIVLFYTLCLIISVYSCKSDKNDASMNANSTANAAAQTQVVYDTPAACDLISASEIKAIVKPKADEVNLVDGNKSGKNTKSSSCFYKWNDQVYDASAVLIQIQSNPFPEDLPTFVTTYMDNKKYDGENSMENPGEKYKYEILTGLEVPAIFNAKLNRYYFGIGEEYLCSVAFNYPIDSETLSGYFVEISKVMLSNIK